MKRALSAGTEETGLNQATKSNSCGVSLVPAMQLYTKSVLACNRKKFFALFFSKSQVIDFKRIRKLLWIWAIC